MERTIRRMGPCCTSGRQVSALLYIICESDSLLVYINEDVNYLNSSSSLKEIAKKTLMVL